MTSHEKPLYSWTWAHMGTYNVKLALARARMHRALLPLLGQFVVAAVVCRTEPSRRSLWVAKVLAYLPVLHARQSTRTDLYFHYYSVVAIYLRKGWASCVQFLFVDS